MTRTVLLLAGSVLVVLGVLFGLQGLGVIGGSAMSGRTIWAVLGPVIAVVGVLLLIRGARTPER